MKKVSEGLLNFAGIFRRGSKKFDGKFSTMKMRLAKMTQFHDDKLSEFESKAAEKEGERESLKNVFVKLRDKFDN
jgi:hypothetical protein